MLRPALRELRRDFNASSDATRVLLLVSPTCEHCLEGAHIVADALARAPDVDVDVLVHWLHALSADSDAVAVSSAAAFGDDDRVRHYWEEADGWSIASEFRPVLGLGDYDPERFAWDVYLLYLPGASWGDTPPLPSALAHNLLSDPPVGDAQRIEAGVVDAWLAGC